MAAAQAAFDDGLTLLYAFNPPEARRSFQRAVAADPKLAIAWWGVAMSYGVDINQSYDPASPRQAQAALLRARTFASVATPAERALINAAIVRFGFSGPNDAAHSATAYRDAMQIAADAFPQDDDVETLTAEAELDVHPWAFFHPDGTPDGDTPATIARLQTVLARSPHHIGANHFLIHATEESPHPELGVPSADALAALTFEPAAEHLIHMPAHTYMRVGRYHDAGDANARAVAAFRTYLASDPAGHGDYFGHDCAFGVDAYLMSDESAKAHAVARACERNGATMAQLVDVRFRNWGALAKDDNDGPFPLGMAAAARADEPAAIKEQKSLRGETDQVSRIEYALLGAAIARERKQPDAEIDALRKAVAIQDDSGYSEPPRFFYPARESLGGALYRAGRYADADAVFRADLERNPNNPRSLFGLARSLERQGLADDAKAVDARFVAASRQADVPFDMNDL